MTIEILKAMAAKTAKCEEEEFMVDNYAGGNVDDAYEIGYSDGQILLAQEVLALLSISQE